MKLLAILFPPLLLGGIALLQEAPPAAPAQYKIPPEIAAKTNPVKPNPVGLAHAKKVWGYDCAICHGATGDGNGEIAKDMKTPLKDYRDPASLKDLSDGELFYIIQRGKDQMPGEEERAKPEDIWNLVTLVHSFAKK